MSDLKQKMHHCENCNAVFTDVTPLSKEAVCSKCGKRPFRLSGFNSMAHLAAVEDDDKSHGVPGQDLADFVSMQKVRRKRQARMAIYLWIGLLLVGVSVAVYNQQVGDDLVGTNNFLRKGLEFKEKSQTASSEALAAYERFIQSANENEESQYVVGGVRKLLLLKSQRERALAFKPTTPMKLLKSNFSEEGLHPRVELMFEDSSNKKIEAIFWETSDGWKLDWEHYVRFSSNDWGWFLEKQKRDDDQEFKLYVRRRHVDRSGENGTLNLVFYMPRIANFSRFQESPQVELGSDSPMYDILNRAFEELERTGDDRLIGSADLPGFLRVSATLGFELDSEGEPQLKLKSIGALNWMEFESTVNKGK